MIRWIIIVVLYGIFNFYAFQSVKTLTSKKWIYILFFALTILVLVNLIYQFMSPNEGRVLTPAKSYALGFFLTVVALKVVLISFYFIWYLPKSFWRKR